MKKLGADDWLFLYNSCFKKIEKKPTFFSSIYFYSTFVPLLFLKKEKVKLSFHKSTHTSILNQPHRLKFLQVFNPNLKL
jgi:hypothetical protein